MRKLLYVAFVAMFCLLMVETVLKMRVSASVVWHLSLPLTNSFNTTETAIFSRQAMLLEVVPL